ncbi:DUF2938 domain-containing protein [Acinetobacter baumannii]|uniref:Permease n=1 Tax=Acinetobacter pittii TaxID=48296 RepID=A0A4Y3J7P7_ACIPI|nr:DUF2938 domain-containing protein [Acinetobacter pittii]MDV7413969.1 DUF2938 domain-containing protein [Acinetobacter baumannii]GEA67392.1 permease [Acinetobacter pittii]
MPPISETVYLIYKTLFIGIGATFILDLWALLLNRLFYVPITNWAMVGRWLGHLPSGQFIQKKLVNARPIPYEKALGWLAHYMIGIGYVLILISIEGTYWFTQPTIIPPLLISWILLIAPFFVMMPGMGAGIAGSNTLHPAKTRFFSFIGHSIFGLGMFISAFLSNLYIG